MVITILRIYMVFVIILMIIYAVRHFVFAYNRLFGKQRLYYNDIYSTRMPSISVLIPMHNEEQVLDFVLQSLLKCEYDRDRLEIIPINDNSTDRTKEMLDEYHEKYEFIRPLHRNCPDRGKPAGLNDAMKIAKGDIIIVFDADYRPARDMLKQLAVAFQDPEVGAVMGRVIPYNTNKNLLTRLINLERCGGYQVDQQARYNLKSIPQYGGTVGGFRKDLMLEMGGFNPLVLAEDTELTYRFYTKGWKVIYANSAECYEEAPETWAVRGRQIRRWARGHNQVLFRYLGKVILTPNMNWREKVDGILLLLVYAVPFFLALGQLDSFILFFLGEMDIFAGWWVLLFIGVYCSFGNFAPFYEIGTGLMLDGVKGETMLLPLIMFNFYFYMWNISLGFLDAIADIITKRKVSWAKTKRFAKADNKEKEGAN
ncbi:glycosyltransferase family 2 protein [Bariatricus massiliensis]|uniref:Glycosyltransferase family 2 protein n=1 Tax=Bariatricus massiliensis TaxID=1745713 RepID=A0ABS8DF78_9FIRM|nr:glycosyltransferase family 2 protein [Bariatricus massiliensis]MCB7303966.1 glycosyltransferase family 2 protein [Bariatricus massiliensis]MCB7374603.1 glycosyltransferase family 2 protein [Bariatricus massiliensis]MCB7387076.1 glycosyltransferase family 2 protein [Bariatricus massiliensis]MCB7411238.1 glycosyltransferase family 2 protein [Bariatricus massiliensis]MCQ5252818.1 glycosyltransferase family 2 protein [Bariatricus massiliensis]